MMFAGLDVRIRRLVVDAEHRVQTAGLSDDILRALQTELTGAPDPQVAPDSPGVGAAIAARIAQSLAKRAGGAS